LVHGLRVGGMGRVIVCTECHGMRMSVIDCGWPADSEALRIERCLLAV
jgi:hypothetical protein